jgi:hypothetical protein
LHNDGYLCLRVPVNLPSPRRRVIAVRGATVSQNSVAESETKAMPAAQTTRGALPVLLAQFFPDATPVRLPVRVEMANGAVEQTVLEFGTAEEVIFSSTLPLEFGDTLTISNSDKSLVAQAHVVALQFHGGATAVAARFSQRVPNWIVKP